MVHERMFGIFTMLWSVTCIHTSMDYLAAWMIIHDSILTRGYTDSWMTKMTHWISTCHHSVVIHKLGPISIINKLWPAFYRNIQSPKVIDIELKHEMYNQCVIGINWLHTSLASHTINLEASGWHAEIFCNIFISSTCLTCTYLLKRIMSLFTSIAEMLIYKM